MDGSTEGAPDTGAATSPDAVLETINGTLIENAIRRPSKLLMLDIPEDCTVTREQGITILKLLKGRGYLSPEQCVTLHEQLTSLDDRREELGQQVFEAQLTDILRTTLKEASTA